MLLSNGIYSYSYQYGCAIRASRRWIFIVIWQIDASDLHEILLSASSWSPSFVVTDFFELFLLFFSCYSCSVCFFSVGIEDAWEKKKRIPPCVNGLFSGLSSASESCACNGSNENENRRNTQKLCYKNRNNYITIAFHTEMAYDKCVFHLSVVSSDCACHCFQQIRFACYYTRFPYARVDSVFISGESIKLNYDGDSKASSVESLFMWLCLLFKCSMHMFRTNASRRLSSCFILINVYRKGGASRHDTHTHTQTKHFSFRLSPHPTAHR